MNKADTPATVTELAEAGRNKCEKLVVSELARSWHPGSMKTANAGLASLSLGVVRAGRRSSAAHRHYVHSVACLRRIRFRTRLLHNWQN